MSDKVYSTVNNPKPLKPNDPQCYTHIINKTVSFWSNLNILFYVKGFEAIITHLVFALILGPHRLTSSLKQQTPVTVINSSIRGMVGRII